MTLPQDIAVAIRARISGMRPNSVEALTNRANHHHHRGLPMRPAEKIPKHCLDRARRMRRSGGTLKGTAKVLCVEPLALALALGERIRNDMSPAHSNAERVVG